MATMRDKRAGGLSEGIDRRALIATALATPLILPLPVRAAAPGEAPPASGSSAVTATIAQWSGALRFAALPPDVVHAARRFVLDSLGCTLTGFNSGKGRLAAEAMIAMGGKPEASVIGSTARISAPAAAFANAELMNALDYDALPHYPPVTLPTLMALAERGRLSGRDFLTSVVVAFEVASRLGGMGASMGGALLETGDTPPVFGIVTEGMFGAAAGAASLLKLDETRTRHALGLAGYYCPPQGSHNWESITPKTQVKYTAVGWICQGAATAALLAEKGYSSNPDILDGDVGFARFYGWPNWNGAKATRELGTGWRILNPDFKPYASCRFTHSQIDCMREIVGKHGLKPDQIAHIRTLGIPFVANRDPGHVRTQEDGQFSTPYVVALAAHGIPIDAHAYSDARLNDPSIRATIAKTEWGVHPDTQATKRKDGRTYVARVEVTTTDGRTLTADRLYASGTGTLPDSRLTDMALSDKFLANATVRLPVAKAQRLLDQLWTLDEVADFSTLMAMTRA